MTSLQTSMKQSHGYFLVTGVVGVTYVNAASSGAGGSWAPGAMTVNAGAGATLSAGQVLRDMGKTVFVGGLASAAGAGSDSTAAAGNVGVPQRVFRKVQLLNATGANVVSSGSNLGNIGNGVGGASYNVFYIELPTLGRGGGSTNNIGGLFTYVPGLPGLYV